MTETITPARIVGNMVESGAMRATLPAGQVLLRGALAGAFLGVATTLAFTVLAQTGLPIVGALIFPVGFSMIVVLGLDLVTGSFAVLPMAAMSGRATGGQVIGNWVLTFVGNFIGALLFAALFWAALTSFGHDNGGAVGDRLRTAVTARSAGYAALGLGGWATCLVKGVLCNWMVCLGVTMGLAASTSVGKIIGCWLPIVIFFGQGFEHAVVNMSLFPLGIALGAGTDTVQFLLWNELPTTLGNLVGGFLFTGLALYMIYSRDTLGREADVRAAASVGSSPQPVLR